MSGPQVKIDDGFPPPVPRQWGRWTETVRRMQVGQSVWVATRKELIALQNAARRLNVKTAGRYVYDDDRGGYRVWRLE